MSHLPPDKKILFENMLTVEYNRFSKYDSNIGDTKDFSMEIKLTDKLPENESYRQLSRHLCDEVTHYVHDFCYKLDP